MVQKVAVFLRQIESIEKFIDFVYVQLGFLRNVVLRLLFVMFGAIASANSCDWR